MLPLIISSTLKLNFCFYITETRTVSDCAVCTEYC